MDAIDEVRRRLGELASMENELCAARGSRDHWRKRAEESESELNALKAELDACWVKLPTDIGGETIRLDDVLVGPSGETFTVSRLEMCYSGWRLWGNGEYVSPDDTIHAEEQRTVEDVLSDFADDVIGCCDDREKLAAAAAEIRELLGVNDEEE